MSLTTKRWLAGLALIMTLVGIVIGVLFLVNIITLPTPNSRYAGSTLVKIMDWIVSGL